jgi:signal peptidase
MDANNLKNSKKKEKEKKPISHKKIIIAAVMICIAFFGSFLVYFGLQVVLNTEAPIVIVVSGSMEPSIREGDLLFVSGAIEPEDIKNGTAEDKNGDVTVFNARGLWAGAPEEPIVHRVVDKYLVGDTWYFRTKGDANLIYDLAPVPEDNIIGVVIGGIPYIGWIKILLTESGLLIPLLVIISAFLVISIIWDIFQGDGDDEDQKKKNDKNQESFEKQPPKTSQLN